MQIRDSAGTTWEFRTTGGSAKSEARGEIGPDHHDLVQVSCTRGGRGIALWFPRGWEALSDPQRAQLLNERKAAWLQEQIDRRVTDIRDGFYFRREEHVLSCRLSSPLQGESGWVAELDLNGEEVSIGPASSNDSRESVKRMAIDWYNRRGRG